MGDPACSTGGVGLPALVDGRVRTILPHGIWLADCLMAGKAHSCSARLDPERHPGGITERKAVVADQARR